MTARKGSKARKAALAPVAAVAGSGVPTITAKDGDSLVRSRIDRGGQGACLIPVATRQDPTTKPLAPLDRQDTPLHLVDNETSKGEGMRTRVVTIAAFACVIAACSFAHASWLSDVTGINIDLQRAVGPLSQINAATQPSAVIQVPTPTPSPTVLLVREEQKVKLQAQFHRAADEFKQSADQYEGYAAAFAIGSILLALAAALSGFLRQAVLAGALSLIVTATTGIPKVVPVVERAAYYRDLYGQCVSLAIEMELKPDMTVPEFNARVEQLLTIMRYGSKLPRIGDATVATDTLIRDIKSKAPATSPAGDRP